jgi:hypothetical protein
VKKIALLFFILLSVSTVRSQLDGKRQKGVCWVGGREVVTEKEIAALVKCNVTWISQTPFAFQRNANASSLLTNFSSDRVWWGESDEGISKTTELARKAKIKTLLKPHIWVGSGWPGEIEMKSDTAWQRWFRIYEKFIVHYAELAEKNKIEIFCIGTELHKTIGKEKEWRGIIAKIRSVYKGKLTYAANFHEEYEQVKFWDALDYIGVQAYFSLTKNESHSIAELKRGWDSPLSSIERVHKKFSRPVIFTEIGYRSDKKAGIEPWLWPKENSGAEISNEAQANCYQAFFQSVWKKSWLEGAYFWKWYPHGPHRMAALDFTPQGKPAEKIVADNFRKNDK